MTSRNKNINYINNIYLSPNSQVQDFDNPTISKIQNFKQLNEGWSFGEGKKFKKNIISKAIEFHNELSSMMFFETDAFPGLNGEIMLTAYKDAYYLEFTFENDDDVTFIFEKDDIEIENAEHLSYEDVINKLIKCRDKIWKKRTLSESLILDIMIDDYKDLKALHSKSHQMEGYPLSVSNVQLVIQTQNADMFESIIQKLPASLRYFGNSRNDNWAIISP